MSKASFLRANPDFFSQSQRVSTSLGLVYFKITPSGQTNGLAVIAPKKHFKRAVDRHQVKRRVRAALDQKLQGYQVVVVPRPIAKTMAFVELKQIFWEVFKNT